MPRAQLIQARNGDSKLLTEMGQNGPHFEQQGSKAPSRLSILPFPENEGRLFNIIKVQGVRWKGIWKANTEMSSMQVQKMILCHWDN